MSRYIGQWCFRHGDWEMDTDNPCDCPQCEKDRELLGSVAFDYNDGTPGGMTVVPLGTALDLKYELQCANDVINYFSMKLALLQKALGVPDEPHQNMFERILEAVEHQKCDFIADAIDPRDTMTDEKMVDVMARCHSTRTGLPYVDDLLVDTQRAIGLLMAENKQLAEQRDRWWIESVRRAEFEDKYNREVRCENNEGDAIGGDGTEAGGDYPPAIWKEQ